MTLIFGVSFEWAIMFAVFAFLIGFSAQRYHHRRTRK